MIERKAYIGDFAVVTEAGLAGSTTVATSYLSRDHLGSIDTITDEAGTIIEQMSFDAWGKRRNIDWTPMVSSTAYITTLTTRGFTGHETTRQCRSGAYERAGSMTLNSADSCLPIRSSRTSPTCSPGTVIHTYSTIPCH